MLEKIIRDPVHDIIAFRLDDPVEALLFSLVNTAEFQRLRRIRQLGLATLAYPGADHSRYSHSLGVLETARRMLDRLSLFVRLDPEQRTICLAAALLHDLGHGPLSHVFESVSGIRHELLTHRIVLDPDSQVHRTLFQHDTLLPEKIVAFLRRQGPRTFYHEIVSSELDADRLDYLLRDNLNTGSRYGQHDLSWLLQALAIDSTGRLAVHHKGVNAVEAYLQARYHMYRNVYYHKIVRSAEGMVRLALQRARRLAIQERLPGPAAEDPAHKALLGQRLNVAEFTDLDDVSILHCFKLWARSSDPPLARLCRGLLVRDLFKTIDLTGRYTAAQARQILAAAKTLIHDHGGDPTCDVFLDQINIPPEEPIARDSAAPTPQTAHSPATNATEHTEPFGGDDIWVIPPNNQPAVPFSSLSPIPAAFAAQLTFQRLHVAAPWKELILRNLPNFELGN